MEGSGSGDRIIAHLGFARAVASRALDPRCRGADREDLVAWGVLGLVQAARRYRDDAAAPRRLSAVARARPAARTPRGACAARCSTRSASAIRSPAPRGGPTAIASE